MYNIDDIPTEDKLSIIIDCMKETRFRINELFNESQNTLIKYIDDLYNDNSNEDIIINNCKYLAETMDYKINKIFNSDVEICDMCLKKYMSKE
jgi:hypothetical protein